jgi:hypothetical protein
MSSPKRTCTQWIHHVSLEYRVSHRGKTLEKNSLVSREKEKEKRERRTGRATRCDKYPSRHHREKAPAPDDVSPSAQTQASTARGHASLPPKEIWLCAQFPEWRPGTMSRTDPMNQPAACVLPERHLRLNWSPIGCVL